MQSIPLHVSYRHISNYGGRTYVLLRLSPYAYAWISLFYFLSFSSYSLSCLIAPLDLFCSNTINERLYYSSSIFVAEFVGTLAWLTSDFMSKSMVIKFACFYMWDMLWRWTTLEQLAGWMLLLMLLSYMFVLKFLIIYFCCRS